MPSGVSLDILGIQIGDTYAEARAKLEGIVADLKGGATGAIREEEARYRLPIGNGANIDARFPSQIILETKQPQPNTDETIWVNLSAPSSGAQVVGIERLILYQDRESQIRISELLPKIEQKFGIKPYGLFGGSSRYIVHFDDGKPVAKPENDLLCDSSLNLTAAHRQADRINYTGHCDIALEVDFTKGLSDDHAKSVWFKLWDAERAKANDRADHQFFHDAIERLRKSTGGAVPKL